MIYIKNAQESQKKLERWLSPRVAEALHLGVVVPIPHAEIPMEIMGELKFSPISAWEHFTMADC